MAKSPDDSNVFPIRGGAQAIVAELKKACFAVAVGHNDDAVATALRDASCRAYAGQAHTSQGARGQAQVRATMRDVGDCVATALAECESANPGKPLAKLDHTAIAQRVLVLVEHMMGVYPNVPRRPW